jgi:glyoxylase-like metal-dependent hydrolase (beta-lactamase superfamily II)
VFWSRVALPFPLDHVNVYLIDDGDSWNVVDTGIANSHAQETWSRLVGGRMAGRPVSKILITHHHPDHVGLASFLAGPMWYAIQAPSLAEIGCAAMAHLWRFVRPRPSIGRR